MFEDVTFAEPDEGPVKATVHKSGKLGFTRAANKVLGFENCKFFRIGRKREPDGNEFLVMVPAKEGDDLAFQISKAGEYYYVRLRRLLKQMGVDYENEKEATTFDIFEEYEEDTKYFVLVKRKKKANKSG
jgi:hypothetical protein